MSELLFGLVSSYGIGIIGVVTFLSCLALPVPSSFVMLAGGAFVASGDLVGWQVVASALAGAILGDQLGYHLGRFGGPTLIERVERAPRRAALVGRGRGMIDRWGGVGVFFTTWAMSPLGPYVNVLAGALGMRRARFTFFDTVGEAIWVAVYVGLGFGFASQVSLLADLATNAVGFLTAGTVAALLGLYLWSRIRRPKSH
jgi:membrane protein DedA with SNARE-associated domain